MAQNRIDFDKEEGRIKEVLIEDEMRSSYLDYAMSVIVARALPDVRDGLKPVHRRIIYGMDELGLQPGKRFRKSARIVGDVMGKYHPHGDSAIYDTLVRLAQDFSLRYPLVDGQGNFGSVDGDTAAAMRYTEARMSRVTATMLADMEKETVDFTPNFDDTLKEPTVLPALLPNLIVNGAGGIAVGMATKIPPHNLGEVAYVINALLDDPDLPVEKVADMLPGPDFPTGGMILGRKGVREAYITGRGPVTMRGKTTVEEIRGKREAIIVNEIPYQVNKTRLIEQIVDLVKNKKIDGIRDIRDESDRDGMRLVIELKTGINAQIVINQLYKHTQLQLNFGVIMIALVDGAPKTLNLKEILVEYIKHRREVIERRTRYDLEQAEKKAHILEGLKIALDNLDEIIAIIRKSKDVPTAKKALMSTFALSDIQAQAILDMRLARLTNLERKKVENDLKATLKLIKELKAILADEKKMYGVLREELNELVAEFSDARRTEMVMDEDDEFSIEDLIAEDDMAITITNQGYIKRTPLSDYKRHGRGTRGVAGHKTSKKNDDFLEHLFIASTHAYLLFFTDQGKIYWLKVYSIPEGARTSKGRSVANLLEMKAGERITAVVPIADLNADMELLMATRKGMIKKTSLDNFSRPKRGGIIATELMPGDSLIKAALDTPNKEAMLITKNGSAIRFNTKTDLRTMGRVTRGVRGIKLVNDDEVVAMAVPEKKDELLVISSGGYGKKTPVEQYRLMRRGGQGVITLRLNDKNGEIIGARAVKGLDDLVLITNDGTINRYAISGISTQGRSTQGVRIMRLDKGSRVVACAFTTEEE